jgi:hypothetical protein
MMAIESLGGGIADQLTQLPADAKQLLEEVLKDTVGGTAQVTQVAPGVTAVVSSGAAVPGAGGEVVQTALLATNAANNVKIDDGLVEVKVSAPASTVVTAEGPKNAATADQANTYLQALLDAAIPPTTTNPGAQQVRQQIEKAIDLITPAAGAGAAVRVAQVKPPAGTADKVVLDFDKAPTVAAVVAQGGAPAKVEVVDAKAVAVVGGAEVAVKTTDGSGVRVVGDTSAQRLDGAQNAGKDTLIGGAGNDTLIGGAGDVIGFNGLGHFTIDGANRGLTFTFLFEGINSVNDLAQYLTGVTETATGVTYHFGPSASITLVGVSASDITADMIKFSL